MRRCLTSAYSMALLVEARRAFQQLWVGPFCRYRQLTGLVWVVREVSSARTVYVRARQHTALAWSMARHRYRSIYEQAGRWACKIAICLLGRVAISLLDECSRDYRLTAHHSLRFHLTSTQRELD